MEAEKVYIGPSRGYVVRLVRRKVWTWPQCLGAFIDYALQTKATRINIKFDEIFDAVTITDDGAGCAEPQRFISVEFTKTDPASAIIALGNRVQIESRQQGIARMLTWDWAEDPQSSVWDIDLDEYPSNGDRIGTTIHISSLVKPMPRLTRLIRTMNAKYAPAIEAGTVISWFKE